MILREAQRIDFENYIYEVLSGIEPKTKKSLSEIAKCLHETMEQAINDYIGDIEDRNLRESLAEYFPAYQNKNT